MPAAFKRCTAGVSLQRRSYTIFSQLPTKLRTHKLLSWQVTNQSLQLQYNLNGSKIYITDGLEIQEQAINFYGQTIFDRIFGWSCADECSYGCMWRTVFAFLERGWPIPQFYGKWPFLRLFGMQEPASVIFSVLNFVMHLRLLRKFRREVRSDSPCYKLAHIFGLVRVAALLLIVFFVNMCFS